MGRTASGVRGIDLNGSKVVGAEVVKPNDLILIVTDKGYGKKTLVDEYRLTHRGSKGVKALNLTEKNGSMVALKCINDNNPVDLMIITNEGMIMRMPIDQVSTLKRATQGLRLIKLRDDQTVANVTLVEKAENSEEPNTETEQNNTENGESNE